MHILLFDLQTAGHHIPHVQYLSSFYLEKGHRVSFVTSVVEYNLDNRLPTNDSNFEVKHLDSYYANPRGSGVFLSRWIQFKGLSEVAKLIEDLKPDLVHLMAIDGMEIPYVLFRLFPGKTQLPPGFATLVAPHFLKGRSNVSHPHLSKYFNLMQSRALSASLRKGWLERLFVLSKKGKKRLLSAWANVPDEKIKAVPDPIEPFYNKLSKKEARKKVELPEEDRIALFFGTLRKEKGPDLFLEASRYVSQDVCFVLAGKPTEFMTDKEVNFLSRELNKKVSNKTITRTRFVPDEEVQPYFLSADVVLLPYRDFAIGTSGILQQAAAAGKPVVATNVAQIGETVEKWNLGVLAETENPESIGKAIEKLLDNKDQLQEYRESSIKYAKEHHWKKMAEKILDSYQEVGLHDNEAATL